MPEITLKQFVGLLIRKLPEFIEEQRRSGFWEGKYLRPPQGWHEVLNHTNTADRVSEAYHEASVDLIAALWPEDV